MLCGEMFFVCEEEVHTKRTKIKKKTQNTEWHKKGGGFSGACVTGILK